MLDNDSRSYIIEQNFISFINMNIFIKTIKKTLWYTVYAIFAMLQK